MQIRQPAKTIRQLRIVFLSWLLHLLLQEAKTEIDILRESPADQVSENEADILAELSCALNGALEIRFSQIKEFISRPTSGLQSLQPQMPKGLEYMEQRFVKDFSGNSIKQLKLSFVCGLVCYIYFGLIDQISLPSHYIYAWIIRYSVVLFLLLNLVYIFIYPNKGNTQTVGCVFTTVAGFGIIGMIAISVPGEIAYNNYYAGVFLVILWANTSKFLRFIHSAISSFLIILGYWGVAIFCQDVFQEQETLNYFITNNFFLLSAVVLSLIASFSVEKQARLEFLARTIVVPGAIQEFYRIYNEFQKPEDRIELDEQLKDFVAVHPPPQNLEIFVEKYKQFFLR